MPLAHHLEARKDADMAELGDPAEQPDHFVRAFRTFIEPRGILRIDQHEISASGLNERDAVLDNFGGFGGIEVTVRGSAEAALPAKCGSYPIDWGPHLGGRHGTRLKMSPADFATSFTVSIVLAAMLFCCEGLD